MKDYSRIKSLILKMRQIQPNIPSGHHRDAYTFAAFIESLDELEFYVDKDHLQGVKTTCEACDNHLLKLDENIQDDFIKDDIDHLRHLLRLLYDLVNTLQ